MSTNSENEKINGILAQIQNSLENNLIEQQDDIIWLISKMTNINCQVVATNYLQLEHADWIGNTALHFAAIESKSEAFNTLLNRGADFTIQNSNGLTALHLITHKLANPTSTLYKLDDSFVKSILSMHLRIKNFVNPVDQNGLSHFHIACAANNIEAVKGFLQNGVSIDQTVKMDSQIFPGFTSLHFAAKYSALEVANLLSTSAANVEIKDVKGMTALQLALERKLEITDDINTNKTLRDENDKILLLLLNKNNNDMITTDDWGLSNFHVSCALKDSNVAECLLQKVVDINDTVNMDAPLWQGYSALHFAALCNIDIVVLLMRKGADINLKNAKGVTPFDMCIERYGNKDISQIISLNPIWKDIMLSDGKTKLSDLVFAMKDSNEINEFLKKLSRNISICKDSPLWPGCTPLHLAVILAKDKMKTGKVSERISREILKIIYEYNHGMIFSQDLQGNTPIHLAFCLNNKPVVDILLGYLKECFNLIDRVNKEGLSFTHIVSARNDIHTLGGLISRRTSVNIVYTGKVQFLPMVYPGSTPLHFAAVNEKKKAIYMLMQSGADLYAKDVNNMTPIHLGFLNKKCRVADMLVSSPNLNDSIVKGIGLSHLHVACMTWTKAPEAITRLLEKGADINGRINCQENANVDTYMMSLLKEYANDTPLTIAYDQESFMTRFLLEFGPDIFVEHSTGVALVYKVLDHGIEFLDAFLKVLKNNETFEIRLKAETGMTSLHLACFNVDIKLIKKLLSSGANVNVQIPSSSPILQGYTPLHILLHIANCSSFKDDDIIEAIELLLKAGADVTLQSAKLKTAVYLAYKWIRFYADKGRRGYCLNTMLEAQQDFSVNPTSVEGVSHLHIASYVCNASIVEKFLNNVNIDINQPIDYFFWQHAGYTALHLAAASNKDLYGVVSKQLETVDLLLNRGADVIAEDNLGETPLHVCGRYKSNEIFAKLARSGGDVNARNVKGETPTSLLIKTK